MFLKLFFQFKIEARWRIVFLLVFLVVSPILFCVETWGRSAASSFDSEEYDQKSLSGSTLRLSVSRDNADLKNEHIATHRIWRDVLKEAKREDLACFLGMCTSDEHFVFLYLLDSVVLDEKANTRLLDEMVPYVDYPLTSEWARTLYKSYKKRIFKKERHMWEGAYKRLTRDIVEDSLFSTQVVSILSSEPQKD